MDDKKPLIIVFAGPNGSGKSTITEFVDLKNCVYINADLIKSTIHCTDMEAAIAATEKREALLSQHRDFAFETVLSTTRNIDLLKKAKEEGYFIKCFYILTSDPVFNVVRVENRVSEGGHNVPVEKIISRYYKALNLVPELIEICDVVHIYDNSDKPFRIFKKKRDQMFAWSNDYWSYEQIQQLVKINID